METLQTVSSEEIRARIESGEPIRVLAEAFGVTPEALLQHAGNPFVYSTEWYDHGYHVLQCQTESKTFEEVIQQYEDNGYFKKYNTYLDYLILPPKPLQWLEIGCHLGLGAYAAARRFPRIRIDMFDFSEKSVAWCRRTFPYPDRARIWQCSCDRIHYNEDKLAERYHVVTCLDVTEHLPPEVYRKTIQEIVRVLRPYGMLLLQQGNIPTPSHINVLTEEQLVNDFKEGGLECIGSRIYAPKVIAFHLFQKKP